MSIKYYTLIIENFVDYGGCNGATSDPVFEGDFKSLTRAKQHAARWAKANEKKKRPLSWKKDKIWGDGRIVAGDAYRIEYTIYPETLKFLDA